MEQETTLTQEIIKGNKLIAEFMGFKIWYLDGHEVNVETSPERCQPINEWAKYHTSWDWLMPVVQKILGMATIDDRYMEIVNIEIFTDINKVWEAVVDYITAKQSNV